MQAPTGADLIGVDEAGPFGHGAPEVERGDRRPVGTVAQAFVGDAPQRVARLHDMGCPGHGALGRRRVWRGRKTDTDLTARLQCGGVGARRQYERRPDARQRDHTDCDPRRNPVHDRRAPMGPDVAAAHLCDNGAHELRAAGRPGHPRRHGEQTQRIARERPPGVPEPARQGVADHEDEHGGDGREGKQGASTAAVTSRIFRGRACDARPNHRPGRS